MDSCGRKGHIVVLFILLSGIRLEDVVHVCADGIPQHVVAQWLVDKLQTSRCGHNKLEVRTGPVCTPSDYDIKCHTDPRGLTNAGSIILA